jgi:hypothetical protein
MQEQALLIERRCVDILGMIEKTQKSAEDIALSIGGDQ